MAKIISGPSVFTHEDWTRANLTKYANAEVERAAAERLVEESKRLENETEKRTDKTQKDVSKKLEQRLDDITFWKQELDDKLDALAKEIDSILVFKSRIEKAQEGTRDQLNIAQQCLLNREKRLGIDLVHDDVQKDLIKEVETVQGVQALLQRTHEQAVEQIRLNRRSRYLLDKDLKDKFSAMTIDEYCQNLRSSSTGLSFKDGVSVIEATSVTPDEWQDFSNDNIEQGERERESSVALRSLMDGILQQTSNDMEKQRRTVDLDFSRRIAETKDTKAKLEAHLNKVLSQITEIEENISRLKRAIAEKEAPLKLAHTRLNTRTHRPNVELCRDHVQYRLIEEVGELERSIAELQGRLEESEKSLKGLTRNQLILEEDIAIKANTIYVDDVECMGIRKSISVHSY